MELQDAEECWSQLISIIRRNVISRDQGKPFIDIFMSGEISSTFVCDESTDEPPVTVKELFHKLNCHIGISTNFMRDGLLSSLTEKVEKKSEVLKRNAVWTKTSRVSRLPKYLVIHFIRIYWKRGSKKTAKILRRVAFPFEMDFAELCTNQLREKIQAEEIQVSDIDPTMLVDVEPNPTGLYELIGVVTHMGNNAYSGHWKAWTKQDHGCKASTIVWDTDGR